jgi:hypothetical protein
MFAMRRTLDCLSGFLLQNKIERSTPCSERFDTFPERDSGHCTHLDWQPVIVPVSVARVNRSLVVLSSLDAEVSAQLFRGG